MTDTLRSPSAPAAPEPGTGPPPPTHGPRARHPLRRRIAAGLLALVLAGGGWFGWRWTHSGAHELSRDVAVGRFGTAPPGAAGAGPAAGVYDYTGSGTEHVSLPAKTMSEGPGIPGTVTYDPDGCWGFRLDYSDSHWQSTSYCRRGGDVVSTTRAGWYRWDFVAVVISDTATYRCEPAAVTVPGTPRVGQRFDLTCVGGDTLNRGTVTMAGTSEVTETGAVRVGGTDVPAVRVREDLTLSGSQTGTNHADTWYRSDGLPLAGTWSTEVGTATPFGTSTLTASGNYRLQSLTPRS